MRLKAITGGVVILLIAATLVGAFSVSTDAGVYLAAARFTANGHVPYLHFPHAYTPFVLGLHSLLYVALKQPPYWLFAIMQCLVVAAASLVTFSTLAKKLHLKSALAYLLTTVQLAGMLAMQAQSILLEPWILCFVWLSAYCLLPLPAGKGSAFWGGFFIGLAFLCKQYGAAAFFPFALLLLWVKRPVLLGLLTLGTAAPVVLCLLLFWSMGATPILVLKQWYAQNHQQLNTEKLFSLYTWFWGGKILLIILLTPVLLALFSLFKGKKLPQTAILGFCGTAFLLAPTLFRHFDHYFMLPLPFVIIAIAALVNRFHQAGFTVVLASLAILCLIAFGIRQWQNRHLMQQQQTAAIKAAAIIPPNSRTYVPYQLSYLTVINGYTYPFAEKSGFAFMKLSHENFIAHADKNTFYLSLQQLPGATALALTTTDTIYLLKK
ncbi:MAG: DUF2079 domain-containing protein [Chitinophagaceae bacterium]|nr:DUF2079 domain-containing protein [Chitinophagaceae bacterium]